MQVGNKIAKEDKKIKYLMGPLVTKFATLDSTGKVSSNVVM